MTSGNVSDEPIAYEDDDALERLARDRRPVPAARPADPHAGRRLGRARRADRAPLARLRPGRRSPVAAAPPLLAVGAELKNTFALARDGRAWVSTTSATCATTRPCAPSPTGIEHFQRLFAVDARARRARPASRVPLDQARARARACRRSASSTTTPTSPRRWPSTASRAAAGAIYDGTGYGTDGTVWGGELLRGDLTAFERIGHLWPVRMPGGEAAIREPWRMACAWLAEIGHDARAGHRSGPLGPGRRPRPLRPRLAGDHEHGPPVRRRRRDPRRAPHGDLRGPGRGRARGARRPQRDRRVPARRVDAVAAGAPSTPRRRASTRGRVAAIARAAARATALVSTPAPPSRPSCTTSRAASPSRASPRASTTPSRAATAEALRTSPSSSSPAASSRTSCCSPHARAPAPARARPRAPAGQRRRHRLRAGGDRRRRPTTTDRWRMRPPRRVT